MTPKEFDTCCTEMFKTEFFNRTEVIPKESLGEIDHFYLWDTESNNYIYENQIDTVLYDIVLNSFKRKFNL